MLSVFMVVSIIHLISVLCKTQWGQLNQAAPQVTQKSFGENRPQKALCSFRLGGRQARVKHNVLCKAGGRYNVGRGGEEGGKCKQGTRTYGVTGLFWEVPGWGGGQSTRRLRECRMWGEWEIGTWGKEERMGVVKEPNKTWTSGRRGMQSTETFREKKKNHKDGEKWQSRKRWKHSNTLNHLTWWGHSKCFKISSKHLGVCVCV